MKKDFLEATDLTRVQAMDVFSLACELKDDPLLHSHSLSGKSIVLLFEKPSTRTRLSFEIGISHLGAQPIFVDAGTTQLGKGESISDTARTMERYAHAVVARLFFHSSLLELARNFSGHVVNALTDEHHPCQALSDLFTVQEQFGKIEGKNIVFVGNGANNVTHSLILVSCLLGANISVACPKQLMPHSHILKKSEQLSRESHSRIKVLHDAKKAVSGADIVYTDVWVSMGEEQKKNALSRKKWLKPFQINEELLKHAPSTVRVMHCLPAHRGEEITSEVMDSEKSIVWQQAENRLHVQKALLLKLFGEL